MSSRIAYFDCPTGIAGDMCLGALLDAGVPLEYLEQQLGGLGLGGAFRLRPERVQRQGQDGLKLHVELAGVAEEPPTVEGHHHHHDTRHLPEIETLIQGANLSQRARDWSLQVFRRLADAEGSVHGISPDRVHFHEVWGPWMPLSILWAPVLAWTGSGLTAFSVLLYPVAGER